MTDAQGNALEEWIAADSEALVAAKVALVFVVKGENAPPGMINIFEKALKHYETPAQWLS